MVVESPLWKFPQVQYSSRTHMFPALRQRLASKSERTRLIAYNAILSTVTKGASILASLLIIPLTIDYVNPTEYGIWLTISGIIGWIFIFDLGLGNGFRNRFAEAVAKGDHLLARQYVSTTYLAISSIFITVFIGLFLASWGINWSTLLNQPNANSEELQKVFIILMLFTCINMIANIFSSLLAADQRIGIASLISCIGQYLSLGAIVLLTKTTEGSLTNLATFYAGVPALTMLLTSTIMFRFSRYRHYAPKLNLARLSLVRNILSLGGQFFVIYLCLIAIFQIINLVITRELGATAVTEYNIANRYFSIIYTTFLLILGPLWSAFTDAKTKEDYSWMKATLRKIESIWIGLIFLGGGMLLISPWAYQIWIGDAVEIPWFLSCTMLGYVLLQSLGNIYMYLLNGLGIIRIQLVIYVIFALIAWPLMSWSTQKWGIQAVVLIPGIVYLSQAIFGKIQITKYLNRTAYGWWKQ